MINHISILTKDGKSLLFREYGATKIDSDLLAGFLSAFSGFFKEISRSEIKATQTETNKFFYGLLGNLIIVICADLEDKNEEIIKILEEIIFKFQNKYGALLNADWNGERTTFKEFKDEIDKLVLGPIKISIIGYGGVGKSTIMKLIAGKEINLEYIPTIAADIATNNILDPKRSVVFWDFAGQLQFTSLWKSLLKGTRLILLITDSTYQNISSSKKIISDLVQKYFENTKIVIIANKQDLPNRLTPKFIEKILGFTTYGMISINPQYRVKISEILKKNIAEINRDDGI